MVDCHLNKGKKVKT